MTPRILILLALCLSAWPQQPSPPRKLQVLIITGRDDHDWRGATPLMRQYLDAAGIFETRIAEEFRDAGPESFKHYDVAVLVYSDKDPEDRWTDRTRRPAGFRPKRKGAGGVSPLLHRFQGPA